MSHTKGPWYQVGQPWGNGLDIWTNDDPHGGRLIASVDPLGAEEGQVEVNDGVERDLLADAALIADAPAMLSLCHCAWSALQSLRSGRVSPGPHMNGIIERLQKMVDKHK